MNKGTFLKEPLKDFIKSINNQKIEFIKNTKSLVLIFQQSQGFINSRCKEYSESYFSTENNELPKQDSTDKNISNEFNGQLQISELDLDIRALPKNQFLCPICFCRIPEILDENLDNGDLLLRCKFDGIISINIYEYCKKIKSQIFTLIQYAMIVIVKKKIINLNIVVNADLNYANTVPIINMLNINV